MIKKILGFVVLMSLVGGLFSSAGAIPIGNDVEFIPDSRRLGLGIMAPEAKLDINGDIKIRGNAGDTIQAGYVLKAVDAEGLATWGPLEGAAIGFENVTLSGTTVIGNAVTDTTTFAGDLNFTNVEQIIGLDGLSVAGDVSAWNITATKIDGTAVLTADHIKTNDGSQIKNLTPSNITWTDPISGIVYSVPKADTAGGLADGTAVTLGNTDFVAGSSFNASSVTSFSVPANFVAPKATTLVTDAVVASATVTKLAFGTSSTQLLDPISGTVGISPISSIVRVAGEGGNVVLDFSTIDQVAAGAVDGQFLIIRGKNDLATVTFGHDVDTDPMTTDLVLNSGVQFTMGNNDTLTLIYDLEVNAWLEVARTDVLNAAP